MLFLNRRRYFLFESSCQCNPANPWLTFTSCWPVSVPLQYQDSLPMIRGPIHRAAQTGSFFQQATSRRYFALSGFISGSPLPSAGKNCQNNGVSFAPHCFLNLCVPELTELRPKSKHSTGIRHPSDSIDQYSSILAFNPLDRQSLPAQGTRNTFRSARVKLTAIALPSKRTT